MVHIHECVEHLSTLLMIAQCNITKEIKGVMLERKYNTSLESEPMIEDIKVMINKLCDQRQEVEWIS